MMKKNSIGLVVALALFLILTLFFYSNTLAGDDWADTGGPSLSEKAIFLSEGRPCGTGVDAWINVTAPNFNRPADVKQDYRERNSKLLWVNSTTRVECDYGLYCLPTACSASKYYFWTCVGASDGMTEEKKATCLEGGEKSGVCNPSTKILTLGEGAECGEGVNAWDYNVSSTEDYKQAILTDPAHRDEVCTDVQCATGTSCSFSTCNKPMADGTEDNTYTCQKTPIDAASISAAKATCKAGDPTAAQHLIDSAQAKATAIAKCKAAAPPENNRGEFTEGISAECLGCGICSQKDVFQEFVNIYSFIVNISGGLAVLVLIIGGLMYMTAAGSQEKTQTAKKAITGGIVGLVIVLAAYLIINVIISMLGYTGGNWFSPTLK